jgi:hypothetical protein
MFQLCLMCEQQFFDCDLLEQRCINCWRKISMCASRIVDEEHSVSYAEGRGCIAAHEHMIDRKRMDIEVLINPYDAQTENRQYGAWMRGRDRRYGEYLRFLKEQSACEVHDARS